MHTKDIKILSKYEILVNALDDICNNAPNNYKKYHLDGKSEEEKNRYRSLAYIHLFLLIKFGVQDFKSRANMITDESYDGGIDAYFIDINHKTLYIIQSKFRTTESNYESKEIDPTEIVAMDIKNILAGNKTADNGDRYNGKINAMQEKLSKIDNFALYDIKIILLANLHSKDKLKIVDSIFSGFKYDVFDFRRAYEELLFPLCSSTYFQGDRIIIDKNIRGTEKTYSEDFLNTSYGKCTVYLMFVPLRFIAEIMDEYKNSILKYNPRNYLTMSKNPVNRLVAEGLAESNEDFALLNNGITMMCSSFRCTSFNGMQVSTNVHIEDPQIINGGQTGITLARMLKEKPESLEGKKVLLKIIATYQLEKEADTQESEQKEHLKNKYGLFIKSISDATNMQSKIEEADRRANLDIQYSFQNRIFAYYGLLYERKRGEFEEAIHNNLITSTQVLNREKMLKCLLAIQGNCEAVMDTTKEKLFEEDSFNTILNAETNPAKAVYAYFVYSMTEKKNRSYKSKEHPVWGNGTRYGKYALLTTLGYLVDEKSLIDKPIDTLIQIAEIHLNALLNKWGEYEKSISQKEENRIYFKDTLVNYYKSKNVINDIKAYWSGKCFDENGTIVDRSDIG